MKKRSFFRSKWFPYIGLIAVLESPDILVIATIYQAIWYTLPVTIIMIIIGS